MRYSLIRDEDSATITVYVDGEVYTANSDHTNFEAIVGQVVTEGTVDVNLFDVSKAVAQKFERLSERVTVAGGHVYLDGEEVNSSLTNQIVRFINEGVEDFQPLVNFMEKVETNPNPHSREQLFDFLSRHEFTIAPDGDIIAYKGVRQNDDGTLVSCHAGPAIVNGEPMNGNIPQPIGAVIEMARSKVDSDPQSACSTGLHVGNARYAFAFGSVRLKVKVNPRDVVSVPVDSNWEKVRTCRYTVLEVVDTPLTTALDDSLYDSYEDDEYDDYYDDDAPVTVDTTADVTPVQQAVADAYATMGYAALRKAAQAAGIRIQGRRPSYCTADELRAALAGK